MKVLMITSQLPNNDQSLDMAPLVRQIDSVRAQGVDVRTVQVVGRRYVKYLTTLGRLGEQVKWADVIHSHYCFCGWLARSRTRKPIVVSFMGDDLLGSPNQEGHVGPLSKLIVRSSRWLAQSVDATIVKSPEMASVISPTPCHVVPNGVDLDTFRPMDRVEAQRQLGWTEKLKYVLFPGNPDCPRKGFSTARAAFDRATAAIAQPMKLVSLWNVAPQDVPLYMNACDAMFMTSFVEGSPNVVKEAMACNLPVVAVSVGDVAELLAGIEGYAVCPRETDALATALVETLESNRTVEGREALQRRGLDLDTVASRLVKIYSSVVGSCAG